jgi:hypothetical protein
MARTPLVTTALLLLLPAPSLWSWAVYRDPAGFTVDLPQGWTARCDAGAGRVDLEGAEGAVSILPVFSGQCAQPQAGGEDAPGGGRLAVERRAMVRPDRGGRRRVFAMGAWAAA